MTAEVEHVPREAAAATADATMNAMVQHRYGPPDVHAMEQIARPIAGDADVVIRVHAAGISYPDFVMTRGVPYLVRLVSGLRRPKHGVRGSDVAGTVMAVGSTVSDLQPGDEVFGWCGRSDDGGGFAEYARCAHNRLARKPAALSFAQAAALPTSGVTALQAVREWARVQPGQRILINGASGGVGTFAVQIATAFGAEVTGVCSTDNMDLVRSLGAGTVIDYTRQDFTRGAVRYDAILDFPHFASRSLADLRRVLTPNGTLIPASNTRNR